MAPPRGPKKNAIDYFNKGLALQKVGRLNEALQAYNRVFAVDPDVSRPLAHVLACLNIGEIFLKDNYFSGAAYTLRHALAIEPDRLDVRQNYAVSLLALDQPFVAIKQYGMILERAGVARERIEATDGTGTDGSDALFGLGDAIDGIVGSARRTLIQLATHYEEIGKYQIARAAVLAVLSVELGDEGLRALEQRIMKGLPDQTPARIFGADGINRLSRVVTRALRHAPWELDLEIDHEGFVSLVDLLQTLKLSPQWKDLTPEILRRAISEHSGGRLEVCGGRVRALYGHSVPGKVWKEPAVPPKSLYHGTARSRLRDIMADGLLSRRRQYVHLSTTREDALRIGRRKGDETIIFVIETAPLLEKGFIFFKGNDKVWLTDYLPPDVLGIE